MDFKLQVKITDYLYQLMNGELEKLPCTKYKPQKFRYTPVPIKKPLPRSTPEAEGISSSVLQHFVETLSSTVGINAHGVMLLRHGKVIAEGNWKPFRSDYPHILHSMCKSITSMAIGFAIAEGKLEIDEKIVDIFPEKVGVLTNKRIRNITVRHLLTMSSGIDFNEAGTVLERDWIKACMEADGIFEPGSNFAYNSTNSYLLSAIIKKKTGRGLVSYLTPRLFEPLGIAPVIWEKCPLGIEKGGWGLSLKLEDMAKLGQLYLQKGQWRTDEGEKQLLPEAWVEASISAQMVKPNSVCSRGYGYQIWRSEVDGAFQFNGMFGQYVEVNPTLDMVIVIFAGSANLFPQGNTMEIIKRYFGEENDLVAGPLPEDATALQELNEVLDGLVFQRDVRTNGFLPERFARYYRPKPRMLSNQMIPWLKQFLDGVVYQMDSSCGSILPFMMQGLHNNFGSRIRTIGFLQSERGFFMRVKETYETNDVAIGFEEPIYSEVTIRGEEYMVGTSGELAMDEDGRTVLKLKLCFIETCNTRLFKLVFPDTQTILAKLEESPSITMALDKVLEQFQFTTAEALNKITEIASDNEFVEFKMRKVLEPEIKGRRIL